MQEHACVVCELFVRRAIRISYKTVPKLLHDHGFSGEKQFHQRYQHPERTQFEHANAKVQDRVDRDRRVAQPNVTLSCVRFWP